MKTNHIFSNFKRIYNLKDEGGRGRARMLLAGVFSGLAGQLAGGLFYTSFLLEYGLDKSRIGILTFVPYLTCLLNLFSPWLLERFKKRRYILFAGKLSAYTVNIIGITLLPSLVKDPTALLVCFIILTFLANSISQLFSSGYSAWNANFLTDEVRVDYFYTSGCINSAVTWAVALGVSVLGDALAGTEHELLLLTVIRYIAFGLALVDCSIWLKQKEYPYTNTVRAKLINVFTLPFRNKKFLATIFIAALYSFVNNLPSATLNAYILKDVGISYTLCNAINAVYFLFFLLLSSLCKTLIFRFNWFGALSYAVLLQAVSYFAYSFVNADTVWLYVVVRLVQHVTGVIINTIISSLPYVNLPEEDRTCYLSFFSIMSNLFVFTSMMLGTALTGYMGDRTLAVFGMPFTSTQLLLLLCAAGHIVVAVYTLATQKKLQPEYRI